MVTYRVRRLPVAEDEDARRYHLFDRSDQLLLVADQGSAWLPDGEAPQVRFSGPGGTRRASMDLPRSGDHRQGKKQNFAIIFEHAVYALITAMDLSSGTSPLIPQPSTTGKFDRLSIEVEGNRWLALRGIGGEEGPLLTLYDADAADLSVTVDPESADLPEPIGLIEKETGDYQFGLTLPTGRLAQGPLLGLALVYLIDSRD